MLLTNAELVDGHTVDCRIDGEQIAAVDAALDPAPNESVIDAAGNLLLPGAIDAHVHFREPGYHIRKHGQPAPGVRLPAA